jgi:hypothetical protein
MCAGGENPGAGIITLQAFAYGLGGVQRGVELTVARAEGPGVSVPRRTGIVSWREIR